MDKILNALRKNGISVYLINEDVIESTELFFIKRKLDMRRKKNVHHYSVTVYNDFESLL